MLHQIKCFRYFVDYDKQRNEIKNAIDGLVKQIKPNLSSVDFIDPSVFTNLAIAKDFAIKGIDFSTFELPVRNFDFFY